MRRLHFLPLSSPRKQSVRKWRTPDILLFMHILIIGNGVSGITAARHIRKQSDFDITVVSDESDYFFSRTALMYIYMGHLRLRDTQPYEDWFWDKNRIRLKKARVQRIDFAQKAVHTAGSETLTYDKLVLATGSVSNKAGWPGQELEGVGGLYHLQDLDRMERYSAGLQRAVVVGGGLIGVEMAEMFHARHIPVTFLVREPAFWSQVLPMEEAEMVGRHLQAHGIDLRLSTELEAILPGTDPLRAGAVRTRAGERIECGFVGLTVGVRPNIDFLQDSGLALQRGILVDAYLHTNQPDVYAIGDCAELREPTAGRRAIEAVWYTGRMMGEAVARNLCGNPAPYDPGLWFNSAKFFDIEYQVYGNIQARLPEDQASLFWQHPKADKSIRINYERHSGRVLGFNLMGVRYRQEVCERWLHSGAGIETVLQQLGLANFDPEFYAQYESQLVALYNRQSGKNLVLRQKRGLPAVLRFLNH